MLLFFLYSTPVLRFGVVVVIFWLLYNGTCMSKKDRAMNTIRGSFSEMSYSYSKVEICKKNNSHRVYGMNK